MQFSKPRKMLNPVNPGTHFMTTTTYDAREYLNAVGSAYDRNNLLNGSGPSFYRPNDQMAYMSAERAHNFSSLPVPIGMFMNIGHPLTARGYYSQHQQQQQNSGHNSKSSSMRNRGRNSRPGVQFAREDGFGSQIASQEPSSHSFTDGPLTQAPLSMSQISQPPFTAFSQPVLSQAGLSQVSVVKSYSLLRIRSINFGLLPITLYVHCTLQATVAVKCCTILIICYDCRRLTTGRTCAHRLRASFLRTWLSTRKKDSLHRNREEHSTLSHTEGRYCRSCQSTTTWNTSCWAHDPAAVSGSVMHVLHANGC